LIAFSRGVGVLIKEEVVVIVEMMVVGVPLGAGSVWVASVSW
jgi:hypothetical protein